MSAQEEKSGSPAIGSANRKRGSYKKYLQDDDAEIPRSTMWDWRKTRDDGIETSLGNYTMFYTRIVEL